MRNQSEMTYHHYRLLHALFNKTSPSCTFRAHDACQNHMIPPPPQVEEAIFLGIMRLREKMGLKPSQRSVRGKNASGDDYGNPATQNKGGHHNIGKYTHDLWESLGGSTPVNATPGRLSSGGGMADENMTRCPRGGEGRRGSQFWGAGGRLVAFTDTLSAGESALSPAVFDAESGRRAEVRGGRPGLPFECNRIERFFCGETRMEQCGDIEIEYSYVFLRYERFSGCSEYPQYSRVRRVSTAPPKLVGMP